MSKMYNDISIVDDDDDDDDDDFMEEEDQTPICPYCREPFFDQSLYQQHLLTHTVCLSLSAHIFEPNTF